MDTSHPLPLRVLRTAPLVLALAGTVAFAADTSPQQQLERWSAQGGGGGGKKSKKAEANAEL